MALPVLVEESKLNENNVEESPSPGLLKSGLDASDINAYK